MSFTISLHRSNMSSCETEEITILKKAVGWQIKSSILNKFRIYPPKFYIVVLGEVLCFLDLTSSLCLYTKLSLPCYLQFLIVPHLHHSPIDNIPSSQAFSSTKFSVGKAVCMQTVRPNQLWVTDSSTRWCNNSISHFRSRTGVGRKMKIIVC